MNDPVARRAAEELLQCHADTGIDLTAHDFSGVRALVEREVGPLDVPFRSYVDGFTGEIRVWDDGRVEIILDPTELGQQVRHNIENYSSDVTESDSERIEDATDAGSIIASVAPPTVSRQSEQSPTPSRTQDASSSPHSSQIHDPSNVVRNSNPT